MKIGNAGAPSPGPRPQAGAPRQGPAQDEVRPIGEEPPAPQPPKDFDRDYRAWGAQTAAGTALGATVATVSALATRLTPPQFRLGTVLASGLVGGVTGSLLPAATRHIHARLAPGQSLETHRLQRTGIWSGAALGVGSSLAAWVGVPVGGVTTGSLVLSTLVGVASQPDVRDPDYFR